MYIYIHIYSIYIYIYTHGEVANAPYLHHGLVPTQGQQHAGAQLVFSQREQELLGLVAGAHEDVDLAESAAREQPRTDGTLRTLYPVCVSGHSPCWQTAPRRHHRPRPLGCRAGTSRLSPTAR